MAECYRACLVCGSSGIQIPGWPNLTQRCKRFTTASTSTQVAVLRWRYDAEMGTAKLVTHFSVIQRV